MAKTQHVSYGNAIVLPVAAGAVTTPALVTDAGVAITKAANELVPARTFGRRGLWVKNQGANVMSITAPSGSIYPLDAGATLMLPDAGMLEDGAYTITGTAAQTFSFWEAY